MKRHAGPYMCGRSDGLGDNSLKTSQRELWYCHGGHTSCRETKKVGEFIMENLLTPTNTFHSEDNGITNICTCNCHGNHEPQQIDRILCSDNNLHSRVFDSPATNSDHWGLTATIKSKRATTQWKKTGRTVSDTTMVCVLLWMWMVIILLSRHGVVRKTLFALYVFIDGSPRKTSRREKHAQVGISP